MNSTRYSPVVHISAFMLLLMLVGGATGVLLSNHFSKVIGNVVNNECLLTTAVAAPVPLGLRGACSLMCQQNSSCHFFCFFKSNSTCALFRAFVAVRWQGHPVSASTTTYDACYTSWGDPRDIVKTNSPFAYSSILVAGSQSYATDGYACNPPIHFVTLRQSNSYTQIDMQKMERVHTVIVATAWPDHFSDLDVILSNTTDFNLGKKIGRVDGDTPSYSTYSFDTNTSVAGRYITFFQAPYDYHGFADIQLIPEEI
ncbi:uncharacterized protein LOC125179233 [Hyalella azteca]|uniref:Uncharacterized protein LOC125179233 n=1 Tax=Hyalella azteca TaxID=294128 RepID=A0A979FX64_HYAAZ|nr:uncharacterized protein LOC125179233 [Hyalella azteca]